MDEQKALLMGSILEIELKVVEHSDINSIRKKYL